MPPTTLVVACVVAIALLIVLLLVVRSRGKNEAEPARFEAPRELAKQRTTPHEAPKETQTAKQPSPPTREAHLPTPQPQTPLPKVKTPAIAFPARSLADDDDADEATRVDAMPPSEVDAVLSARSEQARVLARSPGALPRPSEPSAFGDDATEAAVIPRPEEDDEQALPSFPLPTPDTVELAPAPAPAPARPVSEPRMVAAPKLPASAPRLAQSKPLPASEPKLQLPRSEPRLTPAKPLARPASQPNLTLPRSEPRVAQAKPLPLPTSEPKVPAAVAKLPVSEPKVPAAVAKLPASEPKVPVAKPEPAKVAGAAAGATKDEHDFSALNDAPAAKAAAAASAAATVAKFAPPANPATADLEKNDPRHAAARRLARISVSEIKLYHEDEVKAGREANDLWKRLSQDISLAKQTFEARVNAEVRERFDYLLDEIVRQLAEGDPKKLGPDAPAMRGAAPAPAAATPAPAVVTRPSEPDDLRRPRPEPGADIVDEPAVDNEAPTKTVHQVLPDAPPLAPTVAKVEAKPEAKVEAKPEAKPDAKIGATVDGPKPAADGKPTGLAARGIPSNPETAELEKNDPRHAAARRLARLSVSEIKLYHEEEVKAGRAAKDLWKRMITDIGLATQTFDKRVDKEVRERFDYLYDEILRQLAEGDVAKLGPDAPKKKAADVAAPPAAEAAPRAPAPQEPVAIAAPKPTPEPKPVPVSEPKVAAAAAPVVAAPAPEAPAATATTPAHVPATAPAGLAARYAAPSNPATAELEKSDPRHAAARRLARLSVSEIKLYHEDEVKAGREAKDLWKRLMSDIGLATQTYEKRVDKEVRERFDYLYDEILRQLAEGDVAKLGPEAPKPKAEA